MDSSYMVIERVKGWQSKGILLNHLCLGSELWLVLRALEFELEGVGRSWRCADGMRRWPQYRVVKRGQ